MIKINFHFSIQTLKELKLNMNSDGCCAAVEAMIKLRNNEVIKICFHSIVELRFLF